MEEEEYEAEPTGAQLLGSTCIHKDEVLSYKNDT